MEILEKLGINPIIAAVKDEETLKEAIESEIEVIFILKSTLLNIQNIVEKGKKAGKTVFVHIDMIDGMSSSIEGLDYLCKKTNLDGIITTKPNLIKAAKKYDIYTIQRFFIIDSISYKNSLKYARVNKPDIVEILPGAMPKIIKKFLYNYKCSLIASGIIMDKEDVIASLNAGAIAISTTKKELWKI